MMMWSGRGTKPPSFMRGIRRCYLEWFMRPRGMLVFLKGLTSFENVRRMMQVAVSHLKIKKAAGACER